MREEEVVISFQVLAGVLRHRKLGWLLWTGRTLSFLSPHGTPFFNKAARSANAMAALAQSREEARHIELQRPRPAPPMSAGPITSGPGPGIVRLA
ncbi:MAG: hypothetical protein ACREXX_16100 [Gammaproteobacteria bacterium]